MKKYLNLFDFKQTVNYKTEALSGLTVAIALVPEAVAFAIIAGLEPLTGLTLEVLANGTVVYNMGSWEPPYGIALHIDSLSVILLLIISGASAFSLVGGQRSIDSQIAEHRQPMFYAAWLLAQAGLSGIVISADAFNIFVFMEISSLASYVLISGGPNRQALPAVFKYLVMGTIGATFYLIGVGLIYMMTGTLNLADMADRVSSVADQTPILVAAGFVTIGLALKAAIFPLHAWLPNAYTHAPHIVTVFLAACATKVALYILLRFDFLVFQPNLVGHTIQFSYFLMPLAAFAIVIASVIAIREQNVKRMLAYSSVAQIGYIMLGASLVTQLGIAASVLHLFNHALAKGTIFLAIVCLALSLSGLQRSDLAGAARQMPVVMAAFVIGGLSLIGVPGTAGFISKWYLISAAVNEGVLGILLIVVIVVGSLMAVAYVWRIVEIAFFNTNQSTDTNQSTNPERNSAVSSDAKVPLPLLLVTCAAALLNLYFGIITELPTTLAEAAASHLLGAAR